MTPYITATQLQRNSKASLNSDNFYQVILNNNEVSGILIPQKAAKMLLESDILTQIKEELWEAQDPETTQLIQDHRQQKTTPIPLQSFRNKYGL